MKPESFREIWKTLNTMTQGSTGPGLIRNDSILIVVVFSVGMKNSIRRNYSKE